MTGKNKIVVKNQYLHKPQEVIHVTGKLDLIQHKCWNIFAVHALKNGLREGKQRFEMTIPQLYKVLGYAGENNVYFKKILNNISKINISGDLFDKDGRPFWISFNLLAQCVVQNGICYYEYPSFVAQLLASPKKYVKILINLQNNFKSGYSLKLYEFLKTRYIEKQGRGTTGEIKLELFRQLMGLDDGSWPEFKVLKRDVILPAIKEMNEKTDLFVELELIKNRQKVVALKFQITENPNKKQNLQGLDLESLDDLDFEDDAETQNQPNPLKIKLEKLGFGENQISKFLNETDQVKVIDSVDYILMRMEKGAMIKDLTAYFNTILKMHREGDLDISAVEDWRTKQAKVEQEKLDWEKKQKEEEEEDQRQAKLSKFKQEKIAKYKQDHPEEVEDICIEVLGRLQNENKTFILEQIKKEAKKQEVSLIKTVASHLLTKHEVDSKIWERIEEEEKVKI